MPKLPEVVTKKIGPLPLWGWVVAGAGAVFVFSRFRGGSNSRGSAGGIGIPVLTPSGTGSISDGGNAVGSPGANARGGTGTQPGGVAPDHTRPNIGDVGNIGIDPLEPSTIIHGFNPDIQIFPTSPGTNPGGATPGPKPWQPPVKLPTGPKPVNLPTAGTLAAQPPGGWTAPPAFQQISPTEVIVPTQGAGNTGIVNPGNRLLGYSNPVTGELSQIPVPGWAAIWA